MVSYKNLRPDYHPTVYRGIKYTTVERPVQRLHDFTSCSRRAT